jgi:hypothetical protein
LVAQLACHAQALETLPIDTGGADRQASLAELKQAERAAQADLVADFVGNPFRTPPAMDPAWLHWQSGTVPRLALAAYEERELPSGLLYPECLAVLADALKDAGCQEPDILGHLRGPGPHYRGCWSVDLLLGKT